MLDSVTTNILGLMGTAVDVTKMHASMTLFLRADPEKRVFDFQAVLDKYYDGVPHPESDRILGVESEDRG